MLRTPYGQRPKDQFSNCPYQCTLWTVSWDEAQWSHYHVRLSESLMMERLRPRCKTGHPNYLQVTWEKREMKENCCPA